MSVVKFGTETLVINYTYQYKDHLGNIRLNYGKDPETNVLKVLEENHYYPFGSKHQNYNTGRRQFGKKEETTAGSLTLLTAFIPPTSEKPMVYKYKYNGKEWQDELGLNVTAMDFRMYDNAVGRFLGIDKLAEFSYSITPYRFAYNNPVYWSDPSGLFETKDEAKKWAKDNGIRTGWFSKNKIEKSEDGTWAVNNKKEGTSHFAVSSIHSDIMGVDAGTVVSSPLLVAEVPKKNKSFGLAIWGDDRAGDTRGWKGTTTHSIESSEIPGASLRARNIRGKSSILDLIRNLFIGGKDAADMSNKVSTIQKINEDPNTSTMEVQNTESVAPPPQAVETAVTPLVQQDTTSQILQYWKDGQHHGGSGFGAKAGRLRALEKAKQEMKENPSLDSIQVIPMYNK